MTRKYTDEELDRLLRQHAAQAGHSALSDDERTRMISSLLARDQAAENAVRETPLVTRPRRSLAEVLTQSLRRPPVIAIALSALALVVLVVAVRFGSRREEPAIVMQQKPAVETPREASPPAATAQKDQDDPRAIITLAAIPVAFQLRGTETTPPPDSTSCATAFSIIQQALRPLGISCTVRGRLMTTTLVVRSAASRTVVKGERLRFRFNAASGEVEPSPGSFSIISAGIRIGDLRATIDRAAGEIYQVLRSPHP